MSKKIHKIPKKIIPKKSKKNPKCPGLFDGDRTHCAVVLKRCSAAVNITHNKSIL
jgi:hypothetical protein